MKFLNNCYDSQSTKHCLNVIAASQGRALY